MIGTASGWGNAATIVLSRFGDDAPVRSMPRLSLDEAGSPVLDARALCDAGADSACAHARVMFEQITVERR